MAIYGLLSLKHLRKLPNYLCLQILLKVDRNRFFKPLLYFLLYFDPLLDWLKIVPLKTHRTLLIFIYCHSDWLIDTLLHFESNHAATKRRLTTCGSWKHNESKSNAPWMMDIATANAVDIRLCMNWLATRHVLPATIFADWIVINKESMIGGGPVMGVNSLHLFDRGPSLIKATSRCQGSYFSFTTGQKWHHRQLSVKNLRSVPTTPQWTGITFVVVFVNTIWWIILCR